MHRSRLSAFLVNVTTAVLLVACGVPANLTPQPTRCTRSIVDSFPDTLEPTDLLIDLRWEDSKMASLDGVPPCDSEPRFTLLADGSAYYMEYIDGGRQTMIAHLTHDEAQALVQRVLDLGFECLESWTNACGPISRDGTLTQTCVEDADVSALQVRLPDGRLKVIRNYGPLANDPEALDAIRDLLHDFRHPEAQPYIPDKACLCIQPLLASPHTDIVLDWPQDTPWLTAPRVSYRCQSTVGGSNLETLLALTGRNQGFFMIRYEGRVYEAELVSWPPGIDCHIENPCLPAEELSSP